MCRFDWLQYYRKLYWYRDYGRGWVRALETLTAESKTTVGRKTRRSEERVGNLLLNFRGSRYCGFQLRENSVVAAEISADCLKNQQIVDGLWDLIGFGKNRRKMMNFSDHFSDHVSHPVKISDQDRNPTNFLTIHEKEPHVFLFSGVHLEDDQLPRRQNFLSVRPAQLLSSFPASPLRVSLPSLASTDAILGSQVLQIHHH